MEKDFRVLTICCAVVIAALLVVGALTGVIRHIVQTSALWIDIVLGIRRSGWAKWAALACFVFWVLVMIAIWLFLLGRARISSGTFSSTEISMTVIVGLASIVGIASAVRIPSGVPAWPATAVMLLVAALQVTSLRVSLLPPIAHR